MKFKHGLLQFPQREGFRESPERGVFVAERDIVLNGYSTHSDSCSKQEFKKGEKIRRVAFGDEYSFSLWERL